MAQETRIGDIIAPAAEGIARHIAAPPLIQNRKRAQWGAGLLAWCAYTAIELRSAAGAGPGHLLNFVERLPDTPQEIWVPVAIWAGAGLLGLLWLSVGLRNLRGTPRNVMSAIWALVLGGGCAAALWYGWYLDREWARTNFLLQGFYWAMLALELVTLWLAVRSPTGSGNAARMVSHFISQHSVTWRTGSRRQF